MIILLVTVIVTTNTNSRLNSEIEILEVEQKNLDSTVTKYKRDIELFIELSDLYEGLLDDIDLEQNPEAIKTWGWLIHHKYDTLEQRGY